MFGDNVDKPLGVYFGGQLLYKKVDIDGYRRSWQGAKDSVIINKNVMALRMQIGYQGTIKGSFTMETFAGLGVGYQKRKETILWEADYNWETESWEFSNESREVEFYRWYPTIHFGIAIGYLF